MEAKSEVVVSVVESNEVVSLDVDVSEVASEVVVSVVISVVES